MYILTATNDFEIARQPRPGFPILLWQDMNSCREVNAFFRYYLMRGAIGSSKSWDTISRALYDYFSFLEAHELSWMDVDRGERKEVVAAYRDYCFGTVGLMRNTVRNRLVYVCAFYEFAMRQGWISKLPYEYEERFAPSSPRYLAHVDASGGNHSVRSVMPIKHKDLPKFLTRSQVFTLLGATSNHHHLMLIRLALQTGLRREELASFPLAYILDAQKTQPSEHNVRLILDPSDGSGMKTKGSKKRVIYMSRRFLKTILSYAKHFRGERASLSEVDSPNLFLTQYGLPWAADGKGIEKIISRLGKSVSIKTHPHMLRHTYATHTLQALQKHRGDTHIEPLVFLKNQLGHSTINQTMVYMHLVNEMADDAVLTYDDELNDWADE